MQHLMDKNHNGSGKFQSYTRSFTLPPPPFVGSKDPYTCEERSIEELDMRKRMFWCNSRLFSKKQSDEYGTEGGFFCAGSRGTDGRVFVFRQSTVDGRKVSPVGELDNVHKILQYVHYEGGLGYPRTCTEFIL